jgi:hypothetical protein
LVVLCFVLMIIHSVLRFLSRVLCVVLLLRCCWQVHRAIRATQHQLDDLFNVYWGSLFRTGTKVKCRVPVSYHADCYLGTKHSYFSLQVERFADLYTSGFHTLANYPGEVLALFCPLHCSDNQFSVSYLFLSTAERLPHEELKKQ